MINQRKTYHQFPSERKSGCTTLRHPGGTSREKLYSVTRGREGRTASRQRMTCAYLETEDSSNQYRGLTMQPNRWRGMFDTCNCGKRVRGCVSEYYESSNRPRWKCKHKPAVWLCRCKSDDRRLIFILHIVR